jgi:hypothetical protein
MQPNIRIDPKRTSPTKTFNELGLGDFFVMCPTVIDNIVYVKSSYHNRALAYPLGSGYPDEVDIESKRKVYPVQAEIIIKL